MKINLVVNKIYHLRKDSFYSIMKYMKSKNYYLSPIADNLSAFSSILEEKLLPQKENGRQIILLCIGSDKVSGDCLGPLVGSKLTENELTIPHYGTLAAPIHAANLTETLFAIEKKYPDPFFIVVDAAVGEKKRIGMVSIRHDPLSPGQGIGKNIKPIGHLTITGLVEEATPDIDLFLPYISMYLVDTLASFIAEGIQMTFCHESRR